MRVESPRLPWGLPRRARCGGAAGWLGRSGVAWDGVYGAKWRVHVWRGSGAAAEALRAMGDALEFADANPLPQRFLHPLLSPGILQPPLRDPGRCRVPGRWRKFPPALDVG